MSRSEGPAEPLLQLQGIGKRYGGVRALEDVDLTVRAGRIHAILGENGAGKSSLIKCMAGVVQPDAGTMRLNGQAVRFASPAAANAAGVVCVFQELSLVPDLTVADNIMISNPPQAFGMINRWAQRRMAVAALARAGARDVHPMALVKDLPLSRRQLVEIAKALARTPRLLILDEATSALSSSDVATVFRVLKDLRREGMALVYISHRMDEIAELADECSVFRNGRHVATFEAGTKGDDEIITMMIGREYSHVFPAKPVPGLAPPAPVLEVRNLSWGAILTNVSLQVGAGEIVGLGGLDGQGQRELLLALFGVLRGVSGELLIRGRAVSIAGPAAAKAPGNAIALIPEDRKTEGLMLPMSVGDNLSFASLGRLSRMGLLDRAAERRAIDAMVALLAIKTSSTDTPVGALSGGNQQKVVVAKWLMTGPQIILLNDPTRGIDVGTKQEMYRLLRKLADEGAAILLYSTDSAELVGCCDRVLVLYEGTVRQELAGSDITDRALVLSAMNMPSGPAAQA